ncbi:MAG: HAMP domain-containing histidine kinase, partial [Sphingobacteriales bacterium]
YTTTETQPNRDKHINRIRDSVKHLNDLLEDFLSLGKLDEGKVGAQPVEFNLKETVTDTLDDVRGLVRPGQEIHFAHEGREELFNDKKLLRNVLINLVSNALKFSEENGNVWIRSRVEGEEAVIAVEDKGIGISDEDQQHLFSSFFRGKNAINIQGTGLGLHIVKRYADLMGGDISLQSRLGEGTTITLRIPVTLNAEGS